MCHLQHKLIGFCNRDEKCLMRGTDWVFKYSGVRFVFKGLMINVPHLVTPAVNNPAREGRAKTPRVKSLE